MVGRRVEVGEITSRSNAYRFLEAVLKKAIEDGALQTRNPCMIRGAGSASTGVEIYTPSREDLRRLVAVSPIDFATYAAIFSPHSLGFRGKLASQSATYLSTQIQSGFATRCQLPRLLQEWTESSSPAQQSLGA
jgi:hypothetical protein